MPNPGRIRITKNSNLTTPLIDYRGVSNNFIEWDGQFQITEFANEDYIEYDFEENEWYFNLYAALPGANLADLLDVEFGTLVDTDTLIYDSNSGKWINSNKLTEAIQDIGSINQEISNINQLNIDQQTEIDNIQTDITDINDSIATINSTINVNSGTTGSTYGGYVPEGGIIMWSGSTVPAGWILCDGSNSTPNLVDRFIIGGVPSGVTAGGTGSPSTNTTFTIASPNLPKHTHGSGTLSIASSGGHGHTVRTHYQSGIGGGIATTSSASDPKDSTDRVSGGSHTHASTDFSGNTSDGGFDNTPVSIAPNKYYILAFIMRRFGYTANSNSTADNPASGNDVFDTFADPNFGPAASVNNPGFDPGQLS